MKRKIISLAFLSVLFVFNISSMAVLRSFALTSEETDVWDGTVSSSFESGSGTKNDPYIIKTPEQFAYFSKTVNDGNSYEGEYIKLVCDLVMNDESFVFESDSGLVKVTNGIEKIYIGTGIKGDKSSANDVFDNTASLGGKFYLSNLSDNTGAYSGKLNVFQPIGKFQFPFSGTFDGGSYSISGLYIRVPAKDRIGVFGYTDGADIFGLSVENSFIMGNSYVGSLLGEADSSTVKNCYSDAVVCGNENVGGICGILTGTKLSSSFNIGTVCANAFAGGVVGLNIGNICDIYNSGIVCAVGKAGGLVGKNCGVIETGYSAGKVNSEESADPITIAQGGTAKNVFYVAGSVQGNSSGFTEEQMRNEASFVGFDFNDKWEIGVSENYNYPTLVSVKHKSIEHLYDNVCDSVCNMCGHIRETSHNYRTSWSRSSEYHFYECTVCGDETEKSGHIYDDACDSICNVCEYDRNTFHNYATAWSSDKNVHWHECLSCGDKKDISDHVPGKDATATTAQVCKICQYTIKEPTVHKHAFVGAWRQGDNGHYKECSCGEKSSSEPHKWNDGVITEVPSENNEGIKTFTCTLCSAEKIEKVDKLPSGADNTDGSNDDQNDTNDDENKDGNEEIKQEQDSSKKDDLSDENDRDGRENLGIAIGVASLGVSLVNLILFATIIVLLIKKKK